jgi:hypothetical protein
MNSCLLLQNFYLFYNNNNMFEEDLNEFKQSNWYDILENIVSYFCVKVNINKYTLYNLPHFNYLFYIILQYFNENPKELKDMVEKRLIETRELGTYNILDKISQNDEKDARQLFKTPYYIYMYLLFLYIFTRLVHIIHILDAQITEFTINATLSTFYKGIIRGPFVNFRIAFCDCIDIIVVMFIHSLFPVNLQTKLTSKLYILYDEKEEGEQTILDSKYRIDIFRQLYNKHTNNEIINNKNKLFFYTSRNPIADYYDLNTQESLINLYRLILSFRIIINRPSSCIQSIIDDFKKCLAKKQPSLMSMGSMGSLGSSSVRSIGSIGSLSSISSIGSIGSLTNLFNYGEKKGIKKMNAKKENDKKLIKRCLKEIDKNLNEIPSVPLKEIILNVNKHYQSQIIQNIKNIITKDINMYKEKCDTDKEVISTLVNIILDKTLELDDLNNLKNLAKFSRKLVNKTCIMSVDQKNKFIQEYDKLIHRKEKIVNTEEELDIIFEYLGIQDETYSDIYEMYT